MAPFIIKNRRTGMYVARQEKPKSASFRMPSANWRWVWDIKDAEHFARQEDLIHPIIQMDIEANAMCLDWHGDEVAA